MDKGLALVRSGQLLYTDDVGRDACGIGGIAAKDGKATAEVVHRALTALKALEHRGGVCGDAGDGAGLTCQIPQAFFREEAKRLKFDQAKYLRLDDRLAIGSFFFNDRDPNKIDAAKSLIQEALADGPVYFVGWRRVPTHDDQSDGHGASIVNGINDGCVDWVILGPSRQENDRAALDRFAVD